MDPGSLPPAQKTAIESVIRALLSATGPPPKRRTLSGMFSVLLDKKDWQDYYEVIPQPRALNPIRASLEKNKYKDALEVFTDLSLVFWNAMYYNEEESQIHGDAMKLKACKSRFTLLETEWKKHATTLPQPRSYSPPPVSAQKVEEASKAEAAKVEAAAAAKAKKAQSTANTATGSSTAPTTAKASRARSTATPATAHTVVNDTLILRPELTAGQTRPSTTTTQMNSYTQPFSVQSQPASSTSTQNYATSYTQPFTVQAQPSTSAVAGAATTYPATVATGAWNPVAYQSHPSISPIPSSSYAPYPGVQPPMQTQPTIQTVLARPNKPVVDRGVYTTAMAGLPGGGVGGGERVLMEKIPAEMARHFAQEVPLSYSASDSLALNLSDPSTSSSSSSEPVASGKLLWFPTPPSNSSVPLHNAGAGAKLRYSMEYLAFLARKRKRERERNAGDVDDENGGMEVDGEDGDGGEGGNETETDEEERSRSDANGEKRNRKRKKLRPLHSPDAGTVGGGGRVPVPTSTLAPQRITVLERLAEVAEGIRVRGVA